MFDTSCIAAAARRGCAYVVKAPIAQGQGGWHLGELRRQLRFARKGQFDPIVTPGEPGTPEADTAHHMRPLLRRRPAPVSNSTLESFPAAPSQPDHRAAASEPKPGLPPNATFGDTAAYGLPTVSWTDSSGTTGPIKATQEFFYYKLGGKSPNIDVRPQPPGPKIVTVQGKNVGMEVRERQLVDDSTEAVLQRQVGGAHQVPRLPG